ncbi:TolC family protein [Rhodocytophaga aerolata]|uniref:TolC family protein n=1 Tax=Rhodocytophaga aerolata TaxID=455078 RepID=A0ABT8REY3_9BACT|nr:TolC family protein [Rhodocytophaga aerolata]MDO1450652.1 TolC family protein [Rhodocytophaga aerolata]
MHSDKSNILYLFLICLLTLGGCKVSAPVHQPVAAKMPDSFSQRAGADSVSIGYMSWKEFFADQYLTNLIDTALSNNPDVLIAIQRVERARAGILARKGALLPSLDVVAKAGVEKFGDYTMNGVGNYDTNLSENISGDRRIPTPTPDYFLGLSSSWEIDIWGKLRNQKKAAYLHFLASEKGRYLVKTALVAQVASAYYELLGLDYELEIIRQNIQLQQKAVELVEVQKMAGRVTQLAVQQFSAQLLNTKSLEAQVQQKIVATTNKLNLLMGRYPQTIARGNPLMEQALPQTIQAGIPSGMLRRRPDIRQAELSLAASKADIDAAKAAYFPSLTISPYLGFNSFNAAMLFNPASIAYGLLGGLTAPLLNRKRVKSVYNQRVSVSKEAFYEYQKAILAGFSETVTSLESIENYRRVTELKEQQVDVLRQAASTANDLFVAGFATYLEVVTAQRNVLEAELQLTATKKQQFLSIIDLYRALGGGWE